MKENPSEMLLSVGNLAAGYGKQEAIRDVSFSVGKSEIVVLLGHNGAGKTTVLKSIIGLKRQRRGDIRFDGESIAGLPVAARIDRGLRLLPEGRGIFRTMTVEENIRVMAESCAADGKAKFGWNDIVALFPILKEKRNQPAGELSGGQQQMLAVSLCLLGNPRCILLDEPSIGLAPAVVESIFRVIQDQCRANGISALIVEQNVNAVLGIADRIVVINNGSISLDTPVTEGRDIDFWKYF